MLLSIVSMTLWSLLPSFSCLSSSIHCLFVLCSSSILFLCDSLLRRGACGGRGDEGTALGRGGYAGTALPLFSFLPFPPMQLFLLSHWEAVGGSSAHRNPLRPSRCAARPIGRRCSATTPTSPFPLLYVPLQQGTGQGGGTRDSHLTATVYPKHS